VAHADLDLAPHARACPFEARAYLDDCLVASSSSALLVEPPGAAPLLLFPASDVRGELPRGDALSRVAPPGFVAFDPAHPQVRAVLVDALPGEPERDHTHKGFPGWGDASDLIDLLNVRRETASSFVSVTRDTPANRHRGVVEGSQMLAQSIVAASRRTEGRRVVSASLVFMRAANTAEPLQIQLDELSTGKNFSTLAPRVRQGDKLCASGIMLLDATAPDVMRHAAPMPDTAGPYVSAPYDMSVMGRDVRFVEGAYTGDPDAPVGPRARDPSRRFGREQKGRGPLAGGPLRLRSAANITF